MAFSREWLNETSEDAEAKSFWDAFFNIFGISRRRIASFEVPAVKTDGRGGFIDLLWKGTLLVEHKSRGKDLDKAYKQALDYFPGIKDRDLPQYVLVSDFARFRLYNLDTNETYEFHLKDLYKHIRLFGFVAGYQTHSFGLEDPVNIKAAEHLGKLHDQLKAVGYEGHQLEIFLVRLLFCLFAEDTSIFEKSSFAEYIEQRTAEDGSNLGMYLAQLFQVLNTPNDRRSKVLDEQTSAFQYVNGRLFAEALPLANFDRVMRETLLECCALDWSRISPAIFGSLFQSIMDAEARRELGAHYTTETNILKALRPLFLDSLWAEFARVKNDRKRLIDFHSKLASLRILDPACGCGNFLVIAYRELRLLEIAVLREIHKAKHSGFLNVAEIVWVDVDQFFGIEIEEFPAQIAQVALWLTDHQMNMLVSEEFGQYFTRLPLVKAPNIIHGNALRLDWREIVRPENLAYIVGNPPFIGKSLQSANQKIELSAVFHDVKGSGVLDFVACWYRKTVEFMAGNPLIRAALVSTSSITQGEQVSILWPDLYRRGLHFHFAHRTFQWNSEARGRAAVHCVIIGFGLQEVPEKWLFDYDTPKSEPHAVRVNNINPYLVDAPDIMLYTRTKPLNSVPPMKYGSKPTDGGNLLLSFEEKEILIAEEPQAKVWIRPFIGADEFLYNTPRYCLWLVDCPPDVLRRMPAVLHRVEAVQIMRTKSKKLPTQKLASTPSLFAEIRQSREPYLLVPGHTSESRYYIPIAYMPPEVICGNANFAIPNATLFHFGVLSSTMHNAWTRAVCGRLESRYRYSAGIVYNNFPWPTPDAKQHAAVVAVAQAVLNARDHFSSATLADLYDPTTMPRELVKLHHILDKAVDTAYGVRGFDSEAKRVAFLFEHYQRQISPLENLIASKPKPSSRRLKASAS